MNNKVTIMADWIKSLIDDSKVGAGMNETCVAYVLYGVFQYGVYGEKVDLGATFGQQFGVLNYVLSTLYPQIDKMQNFSKGEHKGGKYDNDAIKELAMQGLGPKAICEQLGYDPAIAKSISTNRGYKEGKEIFKNGSQIHNTFDF
jgi:hypothetical protein